MVDSLDDAGDVGEGGVDVLDDDILEEHVGGVELVDAQDRAIQPEAERALVNQRAQTHARVLQGDLARQEESPFGTRHRLRRRKKTDW